MDYYEILGVEKDSPITIIKRAYKSQVLTCHPDKVSPSERSVAEERFKLLTEAYQVLSDPIKRSEYDSSKRRMTSNDSALDLFNEFFGRRDLFSDPFSHPFFTRDPFFSNAETFSNNRHDLFSNDPFFSSSARSSIFDRFSNRDSMHTSSSSTSTVIQNGISKTIKETKVGNTITREEIVTDASGKVLSKNKTVNGTPALENSRPGSYKIHIS